MYLLLDLLSVLLEAFDVVIQGSLDLSLGGGDVHTKDTLQGVGRVLNATLQGFEEGREIRSLLDFRLFTARLSENTLVRILLKNVK